MSRLRPRCRLLHSHGHIEYLHRQHLNGRVYWLSTTLGKCLLCSEVFQHGGSKPAHGERRVICYAVGDGYGLGTGG
jgi:hypothetical protein